MDIRPISPDLVDDYFRLFDNAFGDNPHWAGCFCAFYDDPRGSEEWNSDRPGFAETNRANRSRTIREGRARGLLAFDGDGPVGWVNAGPRDAFGNLRIFAEAVADDDQRIGSVMCFVIHPDHRGRGVATGLLNSVDDYFRDLGLACSEAYPRNAPPDDPEFPWTAAYYKGTPEMYEKAGYRVHHEFDHFVAMRKAL